jgi:gamma-glutamyltranspeptidase/glutathione hydrolase
VTVAVDFGGAVQDFHIGAAAAGPYGTVAGVCTAAERYARLPLSALVAPAVAHARAGVVVNAQQAYLFEILEPICHATPAARELYQPAGHRPRIGDTHRDPVLADALERLARDGAAPFYTGDVAAAVCAHVAERGGLLMPEDLAAYAALPREPVTVSYRGRTVLTNPPPSAGGTLLAHALARLEEAPSPPSVPVLVQAMEEAQAQRTPEFLARLGSTTHISSMDADGWACSVTCTNGEGCGEVVPGTGIHLNNMMGEQDLSPFGFFTHTPGRRLPSMMAPTMVVGDDGPTLALGSAGSNRIRSAILQVVVAVLDRGLDAQAAIDAPRLHAEDGVIYVEPGVDESGLAGREFVRFPAANLFFGGAQAVERAGTELRGGCDHRRGGGIAVA